MVLLSANSWVLDQLLKILVTLQTRHLAKMDLRLKYFYETVLGSHSWEVIFFFFFFTFDLHHPPNLNLKEFSHVTQNLFGGNRKPCRFSAFLIVYFRDRSGCSIAPRCFDFAECPNWHQIFIFKKNQKPLILLLWQLSIYSYKILSRKKNH